MSCAVGRTCPSGGRRNTQRFESSPIAYVRFDRPPEINVAVSAPPVVPATFAANHGRSRSRSTPGGASVTGRRLQTSGPAGAGPENEERERVVLRDARCTRRDRLAVAAGVARDAPDGHVDAEPGGGALFFGLRAPEAVLAIRTGPLAALLQRGAPVAYRTCLRLAHDAGFGPLAGRREEQPRLALARGPRRPGQRAGENECGHHFGGHVLPFTTGCLTEPRSRVGGTPGPSCLCRYLPSEADHKTICQRGGNDSMHLRWRWLW